MKFSLSRPNPRRKDGKDGSPKTGKPSLPCHSLSIGVTTRNGFKPKKLQKNVN
jgi:hypothetical protein